MDELRKRAKESFNIAGFSSMATGLTGVQKLLERGMTSAEIKMITGFTIRFNASRFQFHTISEELDNSTVFCEYMQNRHHWFRGWAKIGIKLVSFENETGIIINTNNESR
ncbi:MAG: hypothetical protein MR384_03980 [Lachnospiraceae bacterium]|nr:hypothetical protein [Lachnospiraceae bacterium]